MLKRIFADNFRWLAVLYAAVCGLIHRGAVLCFDEPDRARARRILWLNPLAGDRRYEPTARAMTAALPYVDRLFPAHNLEPLERIVPLLAA